MVTNKIKWKCFALLLLIATTAKAVPGLTVITLDNTEQQFALSQIGKITFEGNTMYLYDHDNNLLGYNSIDQVERITGMDFFPALPDDIEDVVEATADINDWN